MKKEELLVPTITDEIPAQEEQVEAKPAEEEVVPVEQPKHVSVAELIAQRESGQAVKPEMPNPVVSAKTDTEGAPANSNGAGNSRILDIIAGRSAEKTRITPKELIQSRASGRTFGATVKSIIEDRNYGIRR